VTEPRFPDPLPVRESLRDALRVYRLLFQRSVLVAAIVYAAIAVLQIVGHAASGPGAALVSLVAAVATLAGPELVQGALIQIVRNVHEGRVPEGTRSLLTDARRRLWRLIGVSFVYAFGIGLGLVLFIVPGLIVMVCWSLMPAVVMLEGAGVWDSRRRSSQLVRGAGGAVFICLFVTFVVIAAGSLLIISRHLGFGTETFLSFVWSTLTAPFAAHLLTVIYYRRNDPTRPVIDPAVLSWRSVWDGR
jgi:Uncharacterised protein family (UPF0259)